MKNLKKSIKKIMAISLAALMLGGSAVTVLPEVADSSISANAKTPSGYYKTNLSDYVYFDNSETQWDGVWAFWWNSDFTKTYDIEGNTYDTTYYPGLKMKKIGKSDIWQLRIPYGATKIMFNSGVTDEKVEAGGIAYQTSDLEFDSYANAGQVYTIDTRVEPKPGRGIWKTKFTYSEGAWSYYDGDYVSEMVIDPGTAAKSVKLSKTSLTLYKGKTTTLKATVSPDNEANRKVTWTTSNSKVATVSNGKITAKSVGTATITVKTANGKKATCKVTVKNQVNPTSVKLSKTSVTLYKGKTTTLKATVNPSNATNKKVTWTTSNKKVATVSNGKITAKGVGTATITVKTANGKKATCKVTVKKQVNPTSVKLSKTSVKLNKGKTTTIKATVNPSNATNKKVTWKTSNSKVATVKNGKITAKAKGTATITAQTANGKKATCKVSVIVPNTPDYYDFLWEETSDGKIMIRSYTGNGEDVVIPSKIKGKPVTWIVGGGFSFNNDLKSITIPESVTKINLCAFTGCDNLLNINVNAKNKYFSSKNGVLFNKAKTKLIQYPGGKGGKYTVPSSVKIIGEGAFANNNKLQIVDMSDKVTKIEYDAFCGCEGLKKINISNGIKEIDLRVFLRCSKLDNVVIPKNVSIIRMGAFSGCKSLTKLTISPGVKEIVMGAFNGCTKLKRVTIPKSVTKIADYSIGYDVDSIYYDGYSHDIYTKTPGFTIEGYKGSEAEKYAKNNGFKFIAISTAAKSVKLSKTSVTLGKGKTTTLKATVNPSNATNKKVTWATSNKKVATVSNGKITAKGVGTATITVKTANGKKATCKVTVKNLPTSVKLSKTSATLNKGKTLTLKATVSPSKNVINTVSWTSSNSKVATVKNGKVTAKAKGTATITVKTTNGKKATCKITVK